MITVSIVVKDTATPAIRALRAGLTNERLLPVLARSATNTIRNHFDMLESTRPNKLGGARQHYYSGARAGTSFVIDGDYAVIGIRQVGMRLRYYGGTVHAGANISPVTGKPTKYLTIPVTAESYGHRASDFDDMKVLWGSNGPYALARVTSGSIARGAGASTSSVEVLFALKQEVTVEGDETMLPEPEALSDAMTRDFNRYVDMIWRRQALPGG